MTEKSQDRYIRFWSNLSKELEKQTSGLYHYHKEAYEVVNAFRKAIDAAIEQEIALKSEDNY